jgi:putative tryptophan/tyrosine transport system substrate-binding protein
MRIGHLSRPFGSWVLAASLLVLLRTDGFDPPHPVSVAFVGAQPMGQDPTYQSFRQALSQVDPRYLARIRLHYVQGSDVDTDRLRKAVDEAWSGHPRVLVAPTGDSAAMAAARAGANQGSLVFATYLDPLRQGLVDSLRRPGRRTTGVSLADHLHAKRLELLHDAYPAIQRVAVLVDRYWLPAYDFDAEMGVAARRLGLQLALHVADSANEVDRVFLGTAAAAAEAWYIPPTYVAYLAESRIIEHLRRLQQPAMHATVDEVVHGARMAYAQDTAFAFEALARLTLRVASGEEAGQIPVERAKRFELAVRVDRAAERRMRPMVIKRADRVFIDP